MLALAMTVDTWVVMFLTNLGAPGETSQKTGAAFFSPTLLSALDPAVPFNLLYRQVIVPLVSGTDALWSNDKARKQGQCEAKTGSRNEGPAPRVRLAGQLDTPWRPIHCRSLRTYEGQPFQ